MSVNARALCCLIASLLLTAGATLGQGELVPLPDTLPDHPRLLLSAEEIADLRALRAADPWAAAIMNGIISSAEGSLAREIEVTPGERHRAYAGPARDLGLAYQFTEDVRFARKGAEILLAYADLAPTLKRSGSSGLLSDSTLREGSPAVDLAWAYDLIYNAGVLSDAQKRHIENDLLRRIAIVAGHEGHHRNSSNWRTWGLVCLAAGGFATGQRDLIEEAINGVYDPDRKSYLYGASQQIAHSFFADGTFWERSIGYTYYTLRPLGIVAAMAEHSGIDLWTHEWPGLRERPAGAMHDDFGPPGPRSIRYGLDALMYRAFPGMVCARVADSGSRSITADVRIFDAAYRHIPDPKYAWLISRGRQGSTQPIAGWRVWQADGRMEGALDETVAHGGRSSSRLRSESTANRAALYQRVSLEPGRAYRFSVWVRTDQVAGGSCNVRLNSGDEAFFTQRVSGTRDWTQLTCDFTAPDGAHDVGIHCFLERATGTCWYDDVSLTEAGSRPVSIANAGFEGAGDASRRGTSLWDLLYAAPDLPAGHFSFADDAQIGLTGRHINGCTLFPDGGFALLRGDGDNPDATCLELSYGPYGSGHDHPDKLHVTLYGQGRIVAPDAGSWGYDNSMHLTWANQTIAHNTVTVGQEAQYPQRMSNSIWASEGGGKLSVGTLVYFHPGETLKAVRARCDNAYEGVVLDRTLVLLDPFVVDVYQVACDEERQIDWAWHAYGDAESDPALSPAGAVLDEARGYSHIERPQSAQASEATWRVAWDAEEAGLLMRQLGGGAGTLVLGADPSKDDPRTCAIARRWAKDTVFTTVFEPHADQPTLRSFEELDGMPEGVQGLRIAHAGGIDTLLVRSQPGLIEAAGIRTQGWAAWMRRTPDGKLIAADRAGSGPLTVDGQTVNLSTETITPE